MKNKLLCVVCGDALQPDRKARIDVKRTPVCHKARCKKKRKALLQRARRIGRARVGWHGSDRTQDWLIKFGAA